MLFIVNLLILLEENVITVLQIKKLRQKKKQQQIIR